MKKTGLFGGTFNPIHRGHVGVAREVKNKFDLDEVIVIPSYLPPHKDTSEIAAANDRFEMACLAFSGKDGFTVSDIETRRSEISYTIDTVNHFRAVIDSDTRLYMIIGMDAFMEINTWKFFSDIFLLIPFIVMSRPGYGQGKDSKTWETIGTYLKDNISGGYVFSAAQSGFIHAKKKPVFVSRVTPYDISSTAIRKRIKNKKPVDSLVPDNVGHYIHSKGLYL